MVFKLAGTSHTYNMTVNHRRRILHSTSGFPATWNDKTVQLYDDLILSVNEGDLDDCNFVIFQKNNDGSAARKLGDPTIIPMRFQLLVVRSEGELIGCLWRND